VLTPQESRLETHNREKDSSGLWSGDATSGHHRIAAYQGIENLLEANASVRHTFRTVTAAQDIRTDLLGIRGDYLGYLLNGNVHFLGGIEGLQKHMAESQNLLRTLTVDNPAQQTRIGVVGPLIDQRLSRLAHLSNVRKRSSRRGLPDVLLELRQTTALDITSEILSSLIVIENEERNVLNARERTVEVRSHSATLIVLYGTLSCFAVLAFLGTTTRLSITRRLGEFQQLVTSIAEGDLTGKIARGGRDELGVLAQGLNRMVTRLRNMATQTRAVTENLNSAAVDILASAREQSALTRQQVAAYQETSATSPEDS
jgi:methyl-accepting chemotaxis protein